MGRQSANSPHIATKCSPVDTFNNPQHHQISSSSPVSHAKRVESHHSTIVQVRPPSRRLLQQNPHGTKTRRQKHLGLQIPCMYITQGTLKLMKYISHIKTTSILGKMLRLSEETIKLELGMSGNLFDIPYKTSHFLATDSWIKNLWKFLNDHNIHLQDHAPPFDTINNNDKFLMDIFTGSHLPRRDLIILNKCRKYLNVLTIGDIITGDGKHILKSIKHGQPPTCITSKMHWPNQGDPGAAAWSTWRRALKQHYYSNLL